MPETTTPANPPSLVSEEIRLRPRRNFFSFGFALLYLLIACIIALAILPPLLNVNRFKRRIVTSISTSLGRPVHLDSVALVILPFPGFKLENFVVAEDPAFGSEPVIHANEVQANLRIASLYSKKVEFSRISLKEPSINLVRADSGAWNVESILLRAAQISAAPTAQATSGPDPRFPYIEATDARVNIKSGLEKLPFSLTEADFALWLPRPQQWRIRVSGKPTRTDSSASDTGIVSLEGTLGRAERFDLLPIDLAAEWRNVPLGEASRILTGSDAGLRGILRVDISLRGTVGASLVRSTVDLRGLRRADFVPDQPVNILVGCQATSADTFHAIHQIRCSWPPPGEPAVLAFTGDLPDTHNLDAAGFELGTPGLPAATLLQWLRAVSPRVSPDITATGTLTGSVSRATEDQSPTNNQQRPITRRLLAATPHSEAPSIAPLALAAGGTPAAYFSGHLTLATPGLHGGPLGDTPLTLGDLTIASAPSEFFLVPCALPLGGKEPATLEGRFNSTGYSLHLTGSVLPSRLLALAQAIPQFGDGLPNLFLSPSAPQPSAAKELPIHVDLTSNRTWTGAQTWSRTLPIKAVQRHKR